MDVWSNSPVKSAIGAGAQTNYPAMTGDNLTSKYVTFNNVFSGMNQWLFSGWYSNGWTGALKPYTTFATTQGREFTDNRFAYYTDSKGNGNFYPMTTGALRNAGFKYSESGFYNCGSDNPGSVMTPHSTMAILGMNHLANAQATFPCLQYLYNIEGFGTKARLTGLNTKRDTGRSRPRRAKRKGKKEEMEDKDI